MMHLCFNFDASPVHSPLRFVHLTHQNLSTRILFCLNSLKKVNTQLLIYNTKSLIDGFHVMSLFSNIHILSSWVPFPYALHESRTQHGHSLICIWGLYCIMKTLYLVSAKGSCFLHWTVFSHLMQPAYDAQCHLHYASPISYIYKPYCYLQ